MIIRNIKNTDISRIVDLWYEAPPRGNRQNTIRAQAAFGSEFFRAYETNVHTAGAIINLLQKAAD